MEEDRACPQAEIMEKELLEFCRSQSKGGRNNGRETPQVEQGNNLVGSEVKMQHLRRLDGIQMSSTSDSRQTKLMK